jgi:Lon protease-like protein
MASRLPIFPLAAVLFPGTPLPLHIFEPRYRRMLADCLAGDRRFGITPTGEETEVPAPGTVGCIAEVRVNQPLPDGRSNVVVTGGSRFTLTRVLDEPLPYYVALVQPFDDEPGTEPPAEAATRLRVLFTDYYAALRQLGDAEPETPELSAGARELSFQVAAALEAAPPLKQRLLAERSTARRVEALLELLPRMAAAVEAALRIHRRAHANGRGGAQPDIVTG